MSDSQLFPVFSDMAAPLLFKGESLAETNTQRLETQSPTQAILSETRNAVAALALAIGMTPAMAAPAAGPASQGPSATQIAMIGPNGMPDRSPEQKDFLRSLDQHLKALTERGIVAKDTAGGINRDFRKFTEGNPKIYQQPGFEYAIPTIKPFSEPYGPLMSKELEKTQSRRITEILGTHTVTEENITEVFRHMFAAKKEDGDHYDMFVKEVYRVFIEQGSFRKPDGTVDKQAVFDSIESNQYTYNRWVTELNAMRQDGRLTRFVRAVNNAIAYAEGKNLTFKPTQVRKGLVHTASCIAAKPETDPSLYADSCGYTMTWIGERPHPGAVELQFYNSETGEAGYKRMMAPWDAGYAQEVYGPVFSDTQAKANDNFWRDYFKLYIGTARANDAELRAQDSGELLKLEVSIGRVVKLLLCYVQGNPFEGKKVVIPDIKAALDEAKHLKEIVETTASPIVKARVGYRDTMQGYEQVLARAKMVGIKWA